jgi:hypothetical protein
MGGVRTPRTPPGSAPVITSYCAASVRVRGYIKTVDFMRRLQIERRRITLSIRRIKTTVKEKRKHIKTESKIAKKIIIN